MQSGYRYQKVAGRIEQLIHTGQLKQGAKIPSLREMSSLMGVSLNTVREAYSTLEAQYLIEAVPQSGYYVRTYSTELKAVPAVDPSRIDHDEFNYTKIMQNYSRSGGYYSETQLGISSLNPEYYPAVPIARILQDTARNAREQASFDYHLPPGYAPLREQIALISGEEGSLLLPEDMVMTNGCHEAVFLALQVLCCPGDTVVVESPCYYNFFQMLETLKLNVVEIPSHPSDGFSLDTLRFVLENEEAKAFFCIPNFTNPLGICMGVEKKKALVDLLAEFDVPLIEDDIYGSLYFTKERPPTCYSLAEKGNVILCSSFSKNLGPGLRMGWIAPGKYIEEVIRLKTLLNLGNNSIQEIALARYLESGGFVKHMKKTRSALSRQLQQMRKFLIEAFPPGTRVSSPEGGLVFWLTLPEGFDSMELYRRAGKEGIFIAPGKLFSLKRDYGNSLRLNGGVWNEGTRRALTRLGEMAGELLKEG